MNAVNKQKYTASKKQKQAERLARDAKAKTKKEQLQEISRRLDENPDLMRSPGLKIQQPERQPWK